MQFVPASSDSLVQSLLVRAAAANLGQFRKGLSIWWHRDPQPICRRAFYGQNLTLHISLPQ